MKALAWMSKHVEAHPRTLAPTRGRLVVQEAGSRFLPADLGGADWEETVVLGAEDSAALLRLVSEVARRIAAMEHHKASIGCAALIVSGAALDRQTASARELVARALLAHLLAAGSGELLVVAPGASTELRDEMLALVGRLLGEVESQAVTIRVHFHDAPPEAPPKSGVQSTRPEAPESTDARAGTRAR